MKSGWIIVVIGAAVCAGAGDVLAQQDPQSFRHTDAADVRSDAEAVARETARRSELAQSILAAREAASSRLFSAELKASLAGKLGLVPSAALETFANAGGLGDIDALVRDTVGPNVLGDTGADLVFTPVTPCRIVNTTVAGGVIAANTTRNFYVNGSTAGTFENQGGTAGGCGIPDNATSVEMNFVAVGPAAAGDLRAYPFGSPLPLASVINYANVAGLNIANGIAQPVCNAATTTCTFDLVVRADVAASHLVVDVVGYYRAVNKGQYRSFVVETRRDTMTVLPNGTCTELMSLQINAPVAGRVVAEANVWTNVDHTFGTADRFTYALSTTSADCAGTHWGYSAYLVIPAPYPTSDPINHTLPVSEIMNVTPGITTIYLNAIKLEGAGTDEAWYAGLHATFHPN